MRWKINFIIIWFTIWYYSKFCFLSLKSLDISSLNFYAALYKLLFIQIIICFAIIICPSADINIQTFGLLLTDMYLCILCLQNIKQHSVTLWTDKMILIRKKTQWTYVITVHILQIIQLKVIIFYCYHSYYIPYPPHPPSFHHPKIWQRAEIMTVLIVQFSPSSCHSLLQTLYSAACSQTPSFYAVLSETQFFMAKKTIKTWYKNNLE